ncbi:MAG: carbon monoxide dehydrogenase, partial [Desulfobulbaceae bacterium]|nr:carbon monoxide dehydrogenase [Desulfobulbaceae bacterium]
KKFEKHLREEMGDIYGGKWDIEEDPIKLAQRMIQHIDEKRAALGIDKQTERVLFDMEMRRDLGAGGMKDAGCAGPVA